MVGSITRYTGAALLLFVAACWSGQAQSTSSRAFLDRGNAALSQGKLQEAAENFQKAVDSDPSSAPAHLQLGATLARQIMAGNVRPSADSDVLERAQDHFKRAGELTPWAPAPLLALSELDTFLAERSPDPTDRADQYHRAQDLLKQVIALEPGKAELYLRLANLERDEFSPALQQAKAHLGAKPGPIPDSALRRSLQEQYGSLLEDAISNTGKAAEMSSRAQKSLLLMARLLRERALLRDTPEQYTSDLHSAQDYLQQFLAAGGHLDSRDTNELQK